MAMHSRTLLSLVATCVVVAGCELGSKEVEQVGYRGVGMEQVVTARSASALKAANEIPKASPQVPAAGPKAGDIYKNVQVLGDLSVGEFTRLMTALTDWVSPEEGCAYCHAAGKDYADESIYTKIVSRRMLQMTRNINSTWSDHVGETGVTCYTCHRGKNVPEYIWFQDPGPRQASRIAARSEQNVAATTVGTTSLPYDPFSRYLEDRSDIRVVSTDALPRGPGASIQDTERTYGLMIHLSTALGQNCTYCHNSRAFLEWDQSTPSREIAWHGLQMVSTLNNDYLVPLQPEYPDERLGPAGDAPKLNCRTCHQGAAKPLLGVSMLQDYPSLAGD